MTELIDKDDPRYFSQTSEPYDRHHYQIVCQNKSFVVESWDEVQEYWWNNCHSPWFEGTVVHVIDLKVLNEFISRRKNHRLSTFYGAMILLIHLYSFLKQNKQWDVAII